MTIGRIKLFDDSLVKVGEKFGHLTVLGFERVKYPSGGTAKKVLYRCDCGKESGTTTHNITHGQQSCGCFEQKAHIIHGYRRRGGDMRLSQIYNAINQRCNNPNHKNYILYGGRGIKNEWNSFNDFVNDMGESYEQHVKEYGRKNTSIDRINVNGNYCKENCKWATQKEQLANTRRTIFTEIDGERIIASWLSDECQIDITTAEGRIKRFNSGLMDKNDLFHKGPIKGKSQVIIDGIVYTSKDIAKKCGISESSASRRIRKYKEGKAVLSDLLYIGTKPVKERYISQGRLKDFNIK